MTGRSRYDGFSIALHWALALLVIALIPLGLVLARLPFPSAVYDEVHLWHRSLGEVVFILTLATLWWRNRRVPVQPVDDVAWRARAAFWTHRLLLALLVFLAVTKLIRGAVGIGWSFAVWHVEAPFAPNPAISEPLSIAHNLAAYTLIALIVLHVSAAFWRAVIWHQDTLTRIIPRMRRAEPS